VVEDAAQIEAAYVKAGADVAFWVAGCGAGRSVLSWSVTREWLLRRAGVFGV
jgi:hypothetical protein